MRNDPGSRVLEMPSMAENVPRVIARPSEAFTR